MPVPNEVMRWQLEQAAQVPQDNNRMIIEGIDEPTEEQRAARDVQIQQRGGLYHDTIRTNRIKNPVKRA